MRKHALCANHENLQEFNQTQQLAQKYTCRDETQVEATKVKARCKQAFSQKLKDLDDFRGRSTFSVVSTLALIKAKTQENVQAVKKVLKWQPE